MWQTLELHARKEVIFFHTANGGGNSRKWPDEHVVGLAQKLVRERDAAVVMLCGPGETEQARRLAHRANHALIHSMADQDLSLGVAKACIERADLLISTDSGPRHIGAALGTAVVGLCGPIDTAWTYSQHQNAVTVKAHGVECAPCNKLDCHRKTNECMLQLTVEHVYAAAVKRLDSIPARSVA